MFILISNKGIFMFLRISSWLFWVIHVLYGGEKHSYSAQVSPLWGLVFFFIGGGGGRLENGKVVISKLFYNSIESNIYLIIIQHTPLLSYIIWPWVFEKLNLGKLQTLGQYYCSTATAWPRSRCLHTSTTTHNIEPVWKPASRLAYVKLLLSLFKKICNQYMELSQNGMK